MKRQFQAFSYKVENKADDQLDVHIDGIIVDAETQSILKDWFGDETSVSYKSFRDQVTTAKPKVLNVFINSGGGMVTDAMAIRDFLSAQEAAGVIVNRIGRGVIASAATFLLIGKNSAMSENSHFMIHNASGGIYGDVNMIENYARAIRKFNDSVVGVYAKATGLSETVIGNMMDKETWFTAAEAKEKGFVNAIEGAATFTNKISPENWPFENRAILNSYNAAVKEPVADRSSFLTDIKNECMKLFDSFKASLGAAKIDDKNKNIANRDEILAMVESVLTPVINKFDESVEAAKPAAPLPAPAPAPTNQNPAPAPAPAPAAAPVNENPAPVPAPAPEPAAGSIEAKILNLEKELKALRESSADAISKPASEGGKKTAASKFKVEY